MMTEQPDREWVGNPLDMDRGIDPYGIEEIVIELETGDEEVLVQRRGDEFGAYELQQAAHYIHALKHHIPT